MRGLDWWQVIGSNGLGARCEREVPTQHLGDWDDTDGGGHDCNLRRGGYEKGKSTSTSKWGGPFFCPVQPCACSALFCPILPCSALFCPVLPCSALFCPILPYSALFCPILPYSALFCPILPSSALFCPILPYSARTAVVPVPRPFPAERSLMSPDDDPPCHLKSPLATLSTSPTSTCIR